MSRNRNNGSRRSQEVKKQDREISLAALIVVALIIIVALRIWIGLATGEKTKDDYKITIGEQPSNTTTVQTVSDESALPDDWKDSVTAKTTDGVPIPKGFKFMEGTKNTGVVIQSEDSDKNEFVWVPVESLADFKTEETYSSNGYNDDTSTTEYINLKLSIAKYGGFYIGRYEASYKVGIESNKKQYTEEELATFRALTTKSIEATSNESEIINVPGKLWNNVNYKAAKAASSNMYKAGSELNTSGVVSHLVYGVEWDATMKWLEVKGKYGEANTVMTTADITTNGSKWGNYLDSTFDGHGVILPSGSITYTKANNIYDMAGNLFEWTQESAAAPTNKVYRGGSFKNNGYQTLPIIRYSAPESSYTTDIGFRPALYIK